MLVCQIDEGVSRTLRRRIHADDIFVSDRVVSLQIDRLSRIGGDDRFPHRRVMRVKEDVARLVGVKSSLADEVVGGDVVKLDVGVRQGQRRGVCPPSGGHNISWSTGD